jgi:hypothetical protein
VRSCAYENPTAVTLCTSTTSITTTRTTSTTTTRRGDADIPGDEPVQRRQTPGTTTNLNRDYYRL